MHPNQEPPPPKPVVTVAETLFLDQVDRLRLISRGLLEWLNETLVWDHLLRILADGFDELRTSICIMDVTNDATPATTTGSGGQSHHYEHSGSSSDHPHNYTQHPPQSQQPADSHSHVPRARIAKKSWSELKQSVGELRRNLASLASMVPSNINFRTLSDGRTRIYFLGTPPNGWETTLMYADIQPNSCGPEDGDGAESDGEMIASYSATRANVYEADAGGEEGLLYSNGHYNIGDADNNGDDPEELPDEQTPSKKLHWGLLLELALPNMDVYGILPPAREVQLLLERKRLSMLGISSYEIHPASGKIVFPLSTRLYQCQDTGYDKLIVPTEVRCTKLWAALDPQICPDNSDLVAHVSGGDIWVSHTLSGQSERITFAHDGRRSFADDPLSAGTPAYVMQEEFSRYQGYWWQPHSQDGVYRLVYEEVDESDVNLFTFPSSQADSSGGGFEEYRFPRAGTPNAKSKLRLAQFRLSEAMQITDIRLLDMQYPLENSLAWLEYIVRVGWTPDGQYVWLQALNRRQQRLELVLVPLEHFAEAHGRDYSGEQPSTVATGNHHQQQSSWQPSAPLQVICSQRSKKWVNVHNVLEFIEQSDQAVTFLWAAEDTGYRHLYLITASLTVPVAPAVPASSPTLESHGSAAVGTIPSSSSSSSSSNNSSSSSSTTNTTTPASPTNGIGLAPGISMATLMPRLQSRIALTAGDWEVLGDAVWLDRRRRLVYFMGLRETPLERHLYVVSLRRPGVVRLLTQPGSSYAIEFNAERTVMMQTFCSIRRQPSCRVVRVLHAGDDANGDADTTAATAAYDDVHAIRLAVLGTLIEGAAPAEPAHCPVIYRPPLASGDQAYAMVFRPHNYAAGQRYPVVLNVYGGPEVQTVNNTFKGMRQLRMHMLAAQGYCVVCIDARGSWHRGMVFESYLHRRMGQVELADQVEALRWLAAELGYLDMDRVAIHGWSYGGYLSLMGLVQHPDVFRVAIAGAPVTDWEYYDTGYTERYMDLPSQNKEGYVAGSVLTHVTRFPDEDNRLLIIHGLIDENVHFFHTSQLVNQLVKHNKPYQLQVYPGERHSLRNLEASKHYETKLLSFLQNNL